MSMQEMFGNTELNEDFVSEDEDWGPKRRRRRTNADTSGKPGVGRSRALASNISTSKEGPSHENQPDVQKAPTGDGAAIVSRQDAERKIWRRLPDSAVEVHIYFLVRDELYCSQELAKRGNFTCIEQQRTGLLEISITSISDPMMGALFR
jgi:hypothetical protein